MGVVRLKESGRIYEDAFVSSNLIPNGKYSLTMLLAMKRVVAAWCSNMVKIRCICSINL